ncbi:LysR substrate-binding domain-containing protein [Ferruginivarius sediminum]|uniref:LysR family transcriptional regulator n=1 Tax=Ferruginivarius sediminum TaxID=2661937 RepID=A0A369TBJ2_9PROT|nr:LysR substrate-binding domain-containing protein [Ferruginivarius sediminum]RDD61547.1 LysR family transcriptional regulator [Ferruginivarius sediminum]
MIERLDIELLTTFVTIVDCKGFTRAATRLGRTQSSVSMQLKRLEERLGRRLIDRSARNARPTEEGYVLLEYARRIVDLSEEAELRMLAPRLAGRVRVGLPEWIAHDRLQMLLGRFNRAHPDVHLIVRVGSGMELRNAIAMGELDVALAIRPPDETGPAVHREPLLWVGARSICPKLQGEVPLALFSDPCPYRDMIIDTLTDAGIAWREVFTSSSMASVRGAVQAGLGISIFPESALEEGPNGLQRLEGFPALPHTELTVYEGPNLPESPAAHLGAYLRESVTTGPTAHSQPQQWSAEAVA